ncbi:MAG: DUF2892 domain-containing protein [Pseudomonadota bacterium]|nr:DUF2892 domain-containing protein [Pseudomonadota bacterium]
MQLNVGSLDRIIRIAIGIALLALIFILPGKERWWGLIGLLPLGTGLFGFCPAYTLFGLNTCPMKSRAKS